MAIVFNWHRESLTLLLCISRQRGSGSKQYNLILVNSLRKARVSSPVDVPISRTTGLFFWSSFLIVYFFITNSLFYWFVIIQRINWINYIKPMLNPVWPFVKSLRINHSNNHGIGETTEALLCQVGSYNRYFSQECFFISRMMWIIYWLKTLLGRRSLIIVTS